MLDPKLIRNNLHLVEDSLKKRSLKANLTSLKKLEEVKINDDFAKNLGAKDLNDLKELISKQINDEFKNSLNRLSKTKF